MKANLMPKRGAAVDVSRKRSVRSEDHSGVVRRIVPVRLPEPMATNFRVYCAAEDLKVTDVAVVALTAYFEPHGSRSTIDEVTMPVDRRRFTFYLPEPLAKQLRTFCARNRVTANTVFAIAISDYLDEKKRASKST